MELTLKSLVIFSKKMGHLSWIMEALTVTGETLGEKFVYMIIRLTQLKTWQNFILSHTWPSLQVLTEEQLP